MCDAVEWDGPKHKFEPKQIGCHIVCAVCGMLEGTGLNGGPQHEEEPEGRYLDDERWGK
jgi:hypothetical protein